MRREVSLEEIWDGRFYETRDMARLGCGDCQGCHSCCQDMGDTIQLDPMDVARLTRGLGCSFDALLGHEIRLGVVDGIVLPHLAMGENGRCLFLNEKGRCRVHALRPGICRLFPLGRFYEKDGFQYFLQKRECVRGNRTKVKVEKWIDTPNLAEYDQYITKWHYKIMELQDIMQNLDEQEGKLLNTYVIQLFFRMPYGEEESFYEELYRRMERMDREIINPE